MSIVFIFLPEIVLKILKNHYPENETMPKTLVIYHLPDNQPPHHARPKPTEQNVRSLKSQDHQLSWWLVLPL
jgi:hypothetical protein